MGHSLLKKSQPEGSLQTVSAFVCAGAPSVLKDRFLKEKEGKPNTNTQNKVKTHINMLGRIELKIVFMTF